MRYDLWTSEWDLGLLSSGRHVRDGTMPETLIYCSLRRESNASSETEYNKSTEPDSFSSRDLLLRCGKSEMICISRRRTVLTDSTAVGP
jgi:hypothetical protein